MEWPLRSILRGAEVSQLTDGFLDSCACAPAARCATVTDDGLEALAAGCHRLRILELEGYSEITDHGVTCRAPTALPAPLAPRRLAAPIGWLAHVLPVARCVWRAAPRRYAPWRRAALCSARSTCGCARRSRTRASACSRSRARTSRASTCACAPRSLATRCSRWRAIARASTLSISSERVASITAPCGPWRRVASSYASSIWGGVTSATRPWKHSPTIARN